MCFSTETENPERMALEEGPREDEQNVGEYLDAPAHHPSAPPDELFDISTTVDPSYIISLIRKLLPADESCGDGCRGADTGDEGIRSSNADHMDASVASLSRDDDIKPLNSSSEKMEIVKVVGNSDNLQSEVKVKDSYGRNRLPGVSTSEKVWEEYGCVLWDLAGSSTHAELMVHNLILDVLLANLMVSESVRVTEICLGIIGNLACHEILIKDIVSAKGLIGIIVEQLFLDDTQCLNEVCRILMAGLKGTEYITWAESLQSEHILIRILWITENTLNLQLMEKSVGVLLAIIEGRQEVGLDLLPSLMSLGLTSLLVNLLAFEMGKLMNERIRERYSVLDAILCSLEALSAVDSYSQEVCSNKELFHLVCDLVKYPDKGEVSNSCVTAGVLIANVLSDEPALVLEIYQDLPFLQGLLDILSFASNDLEARRALWSTIARLMVKIKEDEISPLLLCHYVLTLVSKCDMIEDDLLDQQLDESTKEHGSSNTFETKSDARTIALRKMMSILNHWNASKVHLEENNVIGEHHINDTDVCRMLDCCRKYTGDLSKCGE